MSHVLEHFQAYQLESILTNLLNYLAYDGVLIVEVPNDNFKIFNPEYVNQSPHLSFFSLDSIKILFEKNGFEILYLNTVGKDKINKNMDNHLKPKQQNFDRIKLFVKNCL